MGSGASAGVATAIASSSDIDLKEALQELSQEQSKKIVDAMVAAKAKTDQNAADKAKGIGCYWWGPHSWGPDKALTLKADGTAEFYQAASEDADCPGAPMGSEHWGTGTWKAAGPGILMNGKGFKKKYGYSYKTSQQAQDADPEEFDFEMEYSVEELEAVYKGPVEDTMALKAMVNPEYWGKGALPP